MTSDHTMRDHQGNVVGLPEEMRTRLIGYIKHQGAKSSDDVAALVDRAEQQLGEALTAMSDAQARFSPSPADWSTFEVLLHLDEYLRGAATMVKAVGEGQAFGLLGDSPPVAEGAGRTFEALKQSVAGAFEGLKSTMRALGESGDLSKTARHPYFDDLNWKEWAVFTYIHCRDHVDQINALKVDASYPKA